MEGDALNPTVVVHRFIDAWPHQHCERTMSKASLSAQYCEIKNLGGTRVKVGGSRIRSVEAAKTATPH
jgi:hypothetical protein